MLLHNDETTVKSKAALLFSLHLCTTMSPGLADESGSICNNSLTVHNETELRVAAMESQSWLCRFVRSPLLPHEIAWSPNLSDEVGHYLQIFGWFTGYIGNPSVS